MATELLSCPPGRPSDARSYIPVGIWVSGSRNQLESLDFHYRTSGILSPLSRLSPDSGHLEPGFWIYVSLSLCARDSVFDDLGTWTLDADHGRLVILAFALDPGSSSRVSWGRA